VVRELLPVTDRGTRTVEAVVELGARLDGIRDGDLATVRVERAVGAAGFWLPWSALTESTRGLWACFVVEEGEGGGLVVARRQLEVLHAESGRAYVTGTLSAGDRVVRGGLHRIVAGDAVRVSGGGGG
jgi:hypothetical protein